MMVYCNKEITEQTFAFPTFHPREEEFQMSSLSKLHSDIGCRLLTMQLRHRTTHSPCSPSITLAPESSCFLHPMHCRHFLCHRLARGPGVSSEIAILVLHRGQIFEPPSFGNGRDRCARTFAVEGWLSRIDEDFKRGVLWLQSGFVPRARGDGIGVGDVGLLLHVSQ